MSIRIVNRGDKSAEVLIYGDIGESLWSEGVTAKKFAEDLKALGRVDTLNVRINSGGGSVFEGVAIYNQLARHRAKVYVDIDGLAASIASVIAMAGQEIRIAENALMMIHNPMGMAVGESGDLRKMADVLDQVKETLVATYARRTGRGADEIGALMDAETWMTGAEAVERGFADVVTEEIKLAALAGADLSRFRHPPKIIEAARAEGHQRVVARQQALRPKPSAAPAPAGR